MKNICSAITIRFTVILLFVTIFSYAQENELPETNGSFYAISVKNLDKAVEWYANHLDFTIESTAENDERKGVLMTRKGCILELAEFTGATDLKEIKSNIESHELFGIFKIGFITSNIEESFKALEESDVEIFFSIVDLPNGKRTFGVKDLEGNIIQFFGE